jgi:hypothetical protein
LLGLRATILQPLAASRIHSYLPPTVTAAAFTVARCSPPTRLSLITSMCSFSKTNLVPGANLPFTTTPVVPPGNRQPLVTSPLLLLEAK